MIHKVSRQEMTFMVINTVTSQSKETHYLLCLILLFLLTIKAFWFPNDFILNAHPGSVIFVFLDLLFRHLLF